MNAFTLSPFILRLLGQSQALETVYTLLRGTRLAGTRKDLVPKWYYPINEAQVNSV
jgi:hypothetical protein